MSAGRGQGRREEESAGDPGRGDLIRGLGSGLRIWASCTLSWGSGSLGWLRAARYKAAENLASELS